MRALVYAAPRELEMREWPELRPGPGAAGRADASSWVEQFRLDEGQQVFARLVDDPRGLVKAVFVL